MKKLISLTLTMILVCLSSSVFAYNTDNSFIVNPKIQIQNAENGISDIPLEKLQIPNSNVMLVNDKGIEIPMKILKTAQLGNVNALRRSANSDLIAVTMVAVVDESQYSSRSSSGTITEADWDATKGVKAYCTIYYEQSSSDSNRYLLTKVTGGWDVDDSSIRVTDREVDYACKGWAPGGYENSQEADISSPGMTFSENTGFDNYVTDDIIACNTRCTLKRGTSSTWTLSIKNQK